MLSARIAARDGEVARDIIRWSRLRSGLGTLDEYVAFLERRPDWSSEALIRRRAEADVIDAGDAAILDFFAEAPFRSGAQGAIRSPNASR